MPISVLRYDVDKGLDSLLLQYEILEKLVTFMHQVFSKTLQKRKRLMHQVFDTC